MATRTGFVRSGANEGDVLLERDRELEVLDRLVQDALAGDAVVALLEGPAGIGKSSLLAKAREKAAAAGFRVVAATGSHLERESPYGVVRQLFESLLLDPDCRKRWLSGSAEPAARVFAPADEDETTSRGSFGILHGLFWLTANVAADRPLCLSVDDLQWCDRASLRFIAYLGRRLEGLGVLVATAARVDDSNMEPGLILDIAHDPAAVAIRLSALGEVAVMEMVRDRLGPDAAGSFCAACHRATGGNPLLLRELLKALQAENIRPDAAHADAISQVRPRAVSRTVLLRLFRLSPDAVVVARAVALLGGGATLPATAALAGLDESRVADATRALVAAEILRPEAPLAFVHALVRDAVYHELSVSERALEHERASKVLAGLGAAPEVVASHLLLVPARADPWVADVLREAGLVATRRGDAESAVSYLRRALEERPAGRDRARLLWELGSVESRVDAAAAAEHLREAHDLLEDPLPRALAAEVLARSLLWTSPASEAVAVARRAIAELAGRHADQRRALEAIECFAVSFGAEVADCAARLARVRSAGNPVRLGAKLLAAVAAWDWALGGGCAQECSEFALAVLADGSLIAGDPGLGAGVVGCVLVLADHEEAPRMWEETMSAARRRGSQHSVCAVNLWRGWTWLQRGELVEAEASLREASDQLRELFGEAGPVLSYGAGLLARTLIERGDRTGARAALASRGNPNPASDGDALLRRSEIELLLAQSQWHEALAAADDYHMRLRGIDNPAWAPWRSLKALALNGLRRHDDAVALLDEELDKSRRWGAPGPLARTLRLLGTLSHDDDREFLHEAVTVAEASPARLEHAKALIALGSALRRSRRRVQAREFLAPGFELANRCGAPTLAEWARTELYAAGGRPRRDALGGSESLTPSEQRIAELAAEGHTNRDIAQTLYVTPRTVEGHLTNIYRKLGISTRKALSGALADPSSA